MFAICFPRFYFGFLYKQVIGFLLFTLICCSCNQNKESDLRSLRVCTEKRLDTNGHVKSFRGPQNEMIALKESMWPHKKSDQITISVKFLNGTTFQKQKVIQYAKTWANVSNGKFKFVYYPTIGSAAFYDVRITFNSGGSESIIGTDAHRVPQDQPTMNLGWVDPTTSELEIQQVILHEFGHVLGLGHEHQSPGASIPWDTAKLHTFYKITQNPPWSSGKTDSNIVMKYNAQYTNYSAYDKLSIMHYGFPSSLTIDSCCGVDWNYSLSPTDISFIKILYPYGACEPNKNCCFDQQGIRIPCP